MTAFSARLKASVFLIYAPLVSTISRGRVFSFTAVQRMALYNV